MERAQIDSYEIYKQQPEEAFTLYEDAPLSVDEENYYTRLRRSKERVQLEIKNEIIHTFMSRRGKGKNKGIKKKTRSLLHRYEVKYPYVNYDVEIVVPLLRRVLGPAIERETTSDIYVLCPHGSKERTASCAISKKLGFVKCFSCGKSHTLATFLSMTQGESRKYREDQLNPPQDDPNQLKIEFPEEKTPGE